MVKRTTKGDVNMAKTNKCNSYVINGQKINVNDIIKHYNGNLGMACNEISQKTLVSFETAKYYVELCQKMSHSLSKIQQ